MKLKLNSLLFLSSLGAAAMAQGPIGTWMLTDGDAGTDALIQGASVNTFAQAAGTNTQYAIAWNGSYLGGTFTTIGRDTGGLGGVYDINHNQVNTFTNFSSFSGQHLDGTLDTTRNIAYSVNFGTGDVIRYGDQYFNAPDSSIYTLAGDIWSITYNAARDTLFLGGDSAITEIDMSGNFVNSFAIADSRARSLAYDPNDQTMWYLDSSGADIVQIDALGNVLQRNTVNLGGNYWGGEIAPVPEPATFLAIGAGLALLALRRRK